MTDEEREEEIEFWRETLMNSQNPVEAQKAWMEMRSLINERSSEKISQMERERGLST